MIRAIKAAYDVDPHGPNDRGFPRAIATFDPHQRFPRGDFIVRASSGAAYDVTLKRVRDSNGFAYDVTGTVAHRGREWEWFVRRATDVRRSR